MRIIDDREKLFTINLFVEYIKIENIPNYYQMNLSPPSLFQVFFFLEDKNAVAKKI